MKACCIFQITYPIWRLVRGKKWPFFSPVIIVAQAAKILCNKIKINKNKPKQSQIIEQIPQLIRENLEIKRTR